MNDDPNSFEVPEKKREKARRVLWDSTHLPEWDKQRLYELFCKMRAADAQPTEDERNEYIHQLMILIAAHYGRSKWISSLRKKGMDPQSVAAEVLDFLWSKTQTLTLDTSSPEALTSLLHTAIRNKTISQLRAYETKTREMSDSQFLDESGEGHMIQTPAPARVDLERFARALRGEEDRIVNAVYAAAVADGRNPRILLLQVLYRRQMCRAVIEENCILEHRKLHSKLRQKIHADDHAYCAYLLTRFIYDYAAEPY